MTCFTEVSHQNRTFNIEFAVANTKYNILGAPFFKKNFQNIDFQQNIITYKDQHAKLPTKTIFSTFTEKNYPLNVKRQFTSNQDQERLYTSQSKIILPCTSYKNLKIFFTS